MDRLGIAPLPGSREQPTLGRTVAIQGDLPGRLFLDLVSHLGVQEAGTILAGHPHEAQIGQWADHPLMPSARAGRGHPGKACLRTAGVLIQLGTNDRERLLNRQAVPEGFERLLVHRLIILDSTC
jgi:hypothetical protein